MKSTDPASLQNLNDIVMPASISWWPLAAGWYFLLGLLFVLGAWFSYRLLRYWQKNRYRREALSELQLLENRINNPSYKPEERKANLRQIPVLLKRTALSVYPRTQVAQLTGESWIGFLNSSLKTPKFTQSIAATLQKVAYSTTDSGPADSASISALITASRYWMTHHQADLSREGS